MNLSEFLMFLLLFVIFTNLYLSFNNIVLKLFSVMHPVKNWGGAQTEAGKILGAQAPLPTDRL